MAVYGSASGLGDKHGTYLTQSNIDLGIIGPVEPGDRFGEALAAGDFNGDGRDDLAIGVPGESSPVPAGYAGDRTERPVGRDGHVVFGSAKGLWGPRRPSPFTPGVCCFPVAAIMVLTTARRWRSATSMPMASRISPSGRRSPT